MGPLVAGDLISLGLRGGQEKKAAWGQPLPWESQGLSGPPWPVQAGVCLGQIPAGDRVFSVGKDDLVALFLMTPMPPLLGLNLLYATG